MSRFSIRRFPVAYDYAPAPPLKMDLTPMRIRGKKRKPGAIVQPQSSALSSTSLVKRQRTSISRQGKLKKQAIAAMPTLQGLPQELLEMVFLYSMNINLPRASPDLGRKLSSTAICIEFVMRSFFHTVDHKANITSRTDTSDPKLQSELLACKFFTWSFFLNYVNKAHDALVKLRGKIKANEGVLDQDAGAFEGLWPFKFMKIRYLSFAEGFLIPEKLLHGFQTDDKVNLLYVLVSFGGEIDWQGSMAGENAIQGLKQAVLDGNERAVAALSVLVGTAKRLSTDTIRHAVVQGGCDVKTLRHLLFNAQILYSNTPREILNFHDPQVWQWAQHNGEKGKLLTGLLKKAENFSLEFYMLPGETDWAKIVPFPYSGPKFDAWASFDSVMREILTRLYSNHGRRITHGRR
ncbi:hypothetical protein EJ04DRAFT_117122 [Polyplosphaeria fusca]|uniref:Uncharacterized protein n=1 Tax=Polyplosphaeria fusca TaxID=682080 RepID=A0A9P4RD65_9PLEO|nr:hypothetical protein EJ04DRAFT_117122 [Polyplosphaeria fusca]